MDYQYYSVLGLMPSATREDIDNAYNTLKAKYSRDRFLVGIEGEEAAEKLQEIEVAYRDIIAELDNANAQSKEQNDYDFGAFDPYVAVKNYIKHNQLDDAQRLLDETNTRNGEWHYLQSVIFYKNNWFLEAKKQLEFAISLEPNNQRYRDSLDKLEKIISSNTISADDLRTTTTGTGTGTGTGYGNGTCTGSTCTDCLMCNMCCNCMSCMGGC